MVFLITVTLSSVTFAFSIIKPKKKPNAYIMDLALMVIRRTAERDTRMLKDCLPISKMSVRFYKNL